MNIQSNNSEMITIGKTSILKNKAIILNSVCQASRYQTFKRNGTSFQVPAGFKLIVRASQIGNTGATAYLGPISYGDDSVDDSAGAPTNNVNISIGGTHTNNIGMTATTFAYADMPLYCEIPAGKYPCGYSPAGTSFIIILCELVAV